MKDFCAIISGGEPSPLSGICNADYIIACDKGLEYAAQNGVTPNIIIGDFDSYSGEIPVDVPVMRLRKEKDDTDTMTAVRYAVSSGYGHIVIYCALGGRLDHLYANMQAAAFAVRSGIRTDILSGDTELYFIGDRNTFGELSVPYRTGYSLSVFSFTDICRDVCELGVKYPLNGAELNNAFPIGVSNEWKNKADAIISVGSGILVIILSKL